MRKFRFPIVILLSTFIGFFSAISLSQIQIKKIDLDENNITTNIENIESDNQREFLDEVVGIVKKDYVDEKTEKELSEAAASGIMSSLDPHSSYLSQDDLKEMQVQTKGEFGGVGIEITVDLSVIKVVSAIEDTPADRAGIKSGDYIIKINGKSIYGLSIEKVVKQLRGKPGTRVNVTILRKDEKKPIEKTITRKIIKVKAVRSAQFKDVAYVKINTFSQQARIGLLKEVNKLKKKIGQDKLKGLVLDLRGNPGGLLDQAVKVSDEFLDKGDLIVSIKGRSIKPKDYIAAKDQDLVKDLPVVVLINEGSASASEIVAGALQDNNRAIIMGQKSFGKGSVQTVLPLNNNGGALRITTSLYYTPSGKSIQAHGIVPDIDVTAAKIEKNDALNISSESDLRGHIKVRIEEEANDKKHLKDDNFDIYDKDYQLARALDLVRGVDIYRSVVKKAK